MKQDAGFTGIERLIAQFTELSSVHSIRIRCTKGLQRKLFCPPSDLLVRRKCHMHFSMGNIRMLKKILAGRHNGADPCFVIGSEQGFSVRGQNALSLILFQLRKYHRIENILFIQRNHTSAIVRMDADRYMASIGFGAGIHMGNQSHDRLLFPLRGKNRQHIAIRRDLYILHPDPTQFLREMLRQFPFSGGTGKRLRRFI